MVSYFCIFSSILLSRAETGGSSSDNPYCQTVLLGTSYSEFLCIKQSGSTLLLASTYAGQTNPIAFPIYSGSQGISIGTAYPPGYTVPGPTTSAATTSTTSSSPNSTITSSPTSFSSLGGTSDVPSSPQPTGAIVGGVVGGVIAICITVIIVALIMRRQRRTNEVPSLETSTQYHQTANQHVQSPYFSKPELDVPTHGLSSHPFGHEVGELEPGHRNNVAGSVAVHEVQGNWKGCSSPTYTIYSYWMWLVYVRATKATCGLWLRVESLNRFFVFAKLLLEIFCLGVKWNSVGSFIGLLSESSFLVDLSIQHMSTQKYCNLLH